MRVFSFVQCGCSPAQPRQGLCDICEACVRDCISFWSRYAAAIVGFIEVCCMRGAVYARASVVKTVTFSASRSHSTVAVYFFPGRDDDGKG